MSDSLRDQTWRIICATFPERQIYIRSDGRVQFFTFGTTMQAMMAGISLLFLCWVAFTSVSTIFKDRIIASKEDHFRQMQTSYEFRRIAGLQLSYDELNGALASAEDHFRAMTDDLEARHRTLSTLIRGKEALRASLGIGVPVIPLAPARAAAGTPVTSNGKGGVALDVSDVEAMVPEAAAAYAPASAPASNSVPTVPLPLPLPDEDSNSSPARPHAFLKGAVQRLGQLFRGNASAKLIDHPSLRAITGFEERLADLSPHQQRLLAGASIDIAADTKRFESTIREAGLNPQALVASAHKTGVGAGGPQIPLPGGTADQDFETRAARALAELEELKTLTTVLRSVPLASPLAGNVFERSSGFGARHDPFTNQLAFHAGLDFSGSSGTPVRVTAPGIVTFAGPRGDFGISVEVDHGFGIKTRYGHLSRATVAVGVKLTKGAQVGRLGSTGRSTGPHLHYEVWYGNTVRNPGRFLKAGQYVLKE